MQVQYLISLKHISTTTTAQFSHEKAEWTWKGQVAGTKHWNFGSPCSMTRIVDDPSSKELDGLDHITAQEATHGSIPAKRAENVML